MRRWKKGLGSDMPVFLMVAESVMNPFPLDDYRRAPRQNYVNVVLPRNTGMPCHFEGCKKQLSHGYASDKKALSCNLHKKEGMINVYAKRCEYNDCWRKPHFALPGKYAVHCSEHKCEGEIDVVHPRCAESGCQKLPTFGHKIRNPIYCAEHKRSDMTSTTGYRCNIENCKLAASYGYNGKAPERCFKHRLDGMDSLLRKGCKELNCPRRAVFGRTDGKPEYCMDHKRGNMRAVISGICTEPGCDTTSSFGLPDTRATHCKAHASVEMVYKAVYTCQHPGCTGRAFYGTPDMPRSMCHQNKTADMTNPDPKKCAAPGCDLSIAPMYTHCANHDLENKRYTRVRENQVASFLREVDLCWTTWDKQLLEGSQCSTRARPDFLYECGSHAVVLEVDELQHARAGYLCEEKRMLDIYNSLGGIPTVFLRFNPDGYKIGTTHLNTAMPERLAALEKCMRKLLSKPPVCYISIVRMYYDHPERSVVFSQVEIERGEFCEKEMHSPAYGLPTLSRSLQEKHGLRVDTVDGVHGADVQVS